MADVYKSKICWKWINHKIGTCIEQVYLMKLLIDKVNIPNKMFCTRIYGGEEFNDLEVDEHMHCFALYYLNDKVYQNIQNGKELVYINMQQRKK